MNGADILVSLLCTRRLAGRAGSGPSLHRSFHAQRVAKTHVSTRNVTPERDWVVSNGTIDVGADGPAVVRKQFWGSPDMTSRANWNLAALAALLVIGGGGVGTLACWRIRQQRLTRRMVELLQEEGRGKFLGLAMASRGTAVQRLLDDGADASRAFHLKGTPSIRIYPLQIAVAANDAEAVEALLRHGADPNIPLDDGMSLQQFAQGADPRILRALSAHGSAAARTAASQGQPFHARRRQVSPAAGRGSSGSPLSAPGTAAGGAPE